MAPILQLNNLRCERDERVLFAGLNCQVKAGEILQVHGPNGSGKTTLLRIILGLNPDFTGDIRFHGESINHQWVNFRQQLLYIGHLPAINRSLTPYENLQWFTHLHGSQSDASLAGALKAVGLRGFEDVPGHHLSAGQHRRVALARLYLTNTAIWVLDEPFTAIDVQGVDELRALFGRHTAQGGVVLITTHQDLGMEQVKILDLGDFYPGPTQEVA